MLIALPHVSARKYVVHHGHGSSHRGSIDPPVSTSTSKTAAVAGTVADGYQHHPRQGLARLALGAIGVVYGDIGTSPLYAMKEVFVGHHPLTVDQLHIFGVVSLIFWSLLLIVTLKYVLVVLRADNNGEGGSLALLALIQRSQGGGRWSRAPRNRSSTGA